MAHRGVVDDAEAAAADARVCGRGGARERDDARLPHVLAAAAAARVRLKSLKLAGFKSFVDPIQIEFPGIMCGIGGPNGCGKSNIIDAIKWVKGELSAKSLRSESLQDVI